MWGTFIFSLAFAGVQQFYVADAGRDQIEHFVPKLHQVLVPIGFDDNDVAEIIVDVEFRDSCEDFYGAEVVQHSEFKDVFLLRVEARRRESFCLEVINREPFIVKVGELAKNPEGYRIFDFKNLNTHYGNLRIREANSSKIDENNYAPVQTLKVVEEPNGLRRSIVLSGMFLDSCMRFKKVHVARTTGNLIEVLPIVDRIDSPACERRATPFEQIVEIPQRDGKYRVDSGRYVFYVRKANGGSMVTHDYLIYE